MRNLTTGSAVNYVAAPATEGGKASIKKGVITEVMTQSNSDRGGSATIDYSGEKDPAGQHLAVARYSLGGEENTFHFEDEASEVKKAAAAQPAAAAPALNGSGK